MVERPDHYLWSSYRALIRLADKPDWLDADSVYEQLTPGKSGSYAAAKYAEFVLQGKGIELWESHLKQQIYLGDGDFIARMQKHAGIDTQNPGRQGAQRKANVSKIQSSAPALDSNIKRYAAVKHHTKAERNQHIANAFYQGGHSQTAIASAFDLSSSTVSRVVKEYENGKWET